MRRPKDSELPLALTAQELGVDYHTAWKMLLRGVLRGRKDGARWLVSRASIAAAKAAREDSEADGTPAAA